MDNERSDMFKLSDLVLHRCEKIGFDKLRQPEKVFFCVWGLEAEINNGGFNQYYFNTSGDYASEAVESLQAIGAHHTADPVKQANALFGASGLSPNRATRQEQIDSLGEAEREKLEGIDQEFYKYQDSLGQLLEEYVIKNADAFRPAD